MSDLERLLAETLRDAGEGYEPSDPVEARRRFLERARRRRWYGFVRLAAVGGVAVAAALFFFPRPSTEENVNRPQDLAGAPEVVARVAVGGEPVSIDSTSGSEVWVAGDDRLVAIDPDTNETTGMIIDLPADEVAVGETTVWVAHDGPEGTVTEVDPSGDKVETRLQVASTEGATWDIAVEGDTLWAVDGFSGNVSSSLHETSFEQPIEDAVFSDVAAADGEVWVLDESEGRVLKMSPVPKGDESYEFTVPAGEDADLASGLGYVWVSPGNGTLVRLDPTTGDNEELDLGDSYMDLTVHEKSVWALVNVDEEHKQLFEVNPGTMEVIGKPLQIEGDANDVVADAGSVWVADGGGEVLRIEPARDTDDAPPPAEDDQSNVEPSPAPLDPGEVLFVYSANGDIYGETLQGEVVLLNPPSGDIEQHPSFAPDGQSIVYERLDMEKRPEGREPFVIQLDLATGEEKAIGAGAWPALAPDGRLASVHADMTAEGLHSAIMISESPDRSAYANEVGTAELPNVSHLSWSPNGKRLVWQASGEGTVIKGAGVDGMQLIGETLHWSPGSSAGQGYVSPQAATSDWIRVLQVCCSPTEGDPYESMDAGRVRFQAGRAVFFREANLDIPSIEPTLEVESLSSGSLSLVPEEQPQARWATDASSPSFFVSDGLTLWLVSSDESTLVGGSADALAGHEGETDFRGLAVHPSLLD